MTGGEVRGDKVGRESGHGIPLRRARVISSCGNQPVRRVHKSFLGDDAAILARSSGEEPASPRHRAGVASMAWRTRLDAKKFARRCSRSSKWPPDGSLPSLVLGGSFLSATLEPRGLVAVRRAEPVARQIRWTSRRCFLGRAEQAAATLSTRRLRRF